MSTVLFALLVSQAQTSTTAEAALLRAIDAAERAAKAAQSAAEAAERAALALQPPAATAPAAPAAAVAEAAPAPPAWAGTIGFGLIWLAGNAETLTVSGNLSLERKSEHWIFGAKAGGAYGQAVAATGPDAAPQVVALNAFFQLRGDRRFTEKVSGYIAGGIDTDHVKAIEYRAFGEGGSGLTWFEHKEEDFVKSSFRTDLAIRYAKESRHAYYTVPAGLPDVDFVAPRLGVAFRYAITKEIIFIEDAEALPNVIGDSRLLLNSTSKLSLRLTSVLSFSTALQIKFDSAPAPTKEELDSNLTLGLELGL
jgi:hypothetical protein